MRPSVPLCLCERLSAAARVIDDAEVIAGTTLTTNTISQDALISELCPTLIDDCKHNDMPLQTLNLDASPSFYGPVCENTAAYI